MFLQLPKALWMPPQTPISVNQTHSAAARVRKVMLKPQQVLSMPSRQLSHGHISDIDFQPIKEVS